MYNAYVRRSNILMSFQTGSIHQSILRAVVCARIGVDAAKQPLFLPGSDQ